MGDSFTGQKTQPTVLKYLCKVLYKSKENPEKPNTSIQETDTHTIP